MSTYQNISVQPGCPWYDMAEKFGGPNLKWCEETVCNLVNEPANAWSNAIYIIIALFIWRSAKSSQNKLIRMYPEAMISVGLASFAYHSTNNFFTQMIDFVGMFVICFLMLLINFIRLNWISIKRFTILFPLLIVSTTYLVYLTSLAHFPYQAIVAIIGFLIGFTEILMFMRTSTKYSLRLFFLSIGSVMIGATFSAIDLNRVWCNPQNHFIQGHALWHLFTALGFYFAFQHHKLVSNNQL